MLAGNDAARVDIGWWSSCLAPVKNRPREAFCTHTQDLPAVSTAVPTNLGGRNVKLTSAGESCCTRSIRPFGRRQCRQFPGRCHGSVQARRRSRFFWACHGTLLQHSTSTRSKSSSRGEHGSQSAGRQPLGQGSKFVCTCWQALLVRQPKACCLTRTHLCDRCRMPWTTRHYGTSWWVQGWS